MDVSHMADRDLLEDEDLSVLLQLASHSNTPRSKDGRYAKEFRVKTSIACPCALIYASLLFTVTFFDHLETEKVTAIGTLIIQPCKYRL